MLNFDTDLDLAGVTRMVVVRDHVAVRSAPTKGHLAVSDESWTWRELRDYVVSGLTQRFGPPEHTDPHWAVKEAGTFKGFIRRWGPERAASIARYAIEVCDARWQGRPITTKSFCQGSDPYFAIPIAERIF